MSRSPIDVEIRGFQTPRERVWAAALRLRTFTLWELQDHTVPLVTFATCDDYVTALQAAGYVDRVGENPPLAANQFPKAIYQVLKPVPQTPRLTRDGAVSVAADGVDAMWRAMKVLPVFDHHDIARAATLGTCKVSVGTAKVYVAALAQAGYLSLVRKSKPGTAARHRLTNNTGPLPPAITRRKVVFDRNKGEFFGMQSAQEVCDALE